MSREKSTSLTNNKQSYPPCPLCGNQLKIRTSERLSSSLQSKRLRCRSSGCNFRCTSYEEFETELNNPDIQPQFIKNTTQYDNVGLQQEGD